MRDSVIERTFDLKANAKGWTLIDKGWPDRIVITPDGIFCVEIKAASGYGGPSRSQKEPLRPHQKRVADILSSAGIKVFIAEDGDPDNLVTYKDWSTASFSRGRAPYATLAIKASTKKTYGYKKLALENEINLAKMTPSFPRERIEQMEARLKQICEKIDYAISCEGAALRNMEAEEAKRAIDEAIEESDRKLDALLNDIKWESRANERKAREEGKKEEEKI